MPELPAWLQKIRDRADKATPGPWVSITGDGPFGTQSNVRTTEGWPEVIASRTIVGAVKPVEQQESNFAFIAHARTDVPRLVELVGEMVELIDRLADELVSAYACDCDPQVPDDCIACGGTYMGRRCLVYDALQMRAKYREEAKSE